MSIKINGTKTKYISLLEKEIGEQTIFRIKYNYLREYLLFRKSELFNCLGVHVTSNRDEVNENATELLKEAEITLKLLKARKR